jgi:hypothetical protein
MKALMELPIFCEQCATLALAILDEAALCEACLMKQVDSHNRVLSAMKIEPLQFVLPKHIHQSDNESFVWSR